MKKETFLNMEEIVLEGNILDVGFYNYGVIYKLYKDNNDKEDVEYFTGKKDKKLIKKNFYDTCVLFFSLSNIWLKRNRSNFLKDIYSYLKEDGIIYVWDVDKRYNNIFKCDLKVMLPQKNIKTIKLKEYNMLKDVSKNTTVNLMKKYFEVIDLKSTDNIYCIKGIKKRRSDNEGSTSRS